MDANNKMKRLKTRKERGQMRGTGEVMSKRKSHHHHFYYKQHQNVKDKERFNSCCQKCSHCAPRRDTQFSRIIPSAQEPSVITDFRLIGHQGLFNHEVKSIDIERLLTEQRKLENLKRSPKKKKSVPHPQLDSYLLPSCSSIDANVEKPFDSVSIENNANLGQTKMQHDCQKDILASQSDSHRSDMTQSQRQSYRTDVLSVILSPTTIPPDVSAKSKKATNFGIEKERDPQMALNEVQHNLTPQNKVTKGQLFSHMEHTPTNQRSSHHLTKSCPPSQNLSHVLNSPGAGTGDRLDTPQQRCTLNPGVSTPVREVALRLCNYLKLPSLNTRLLLESRGVLLQALQHMHGPQLQENLLDVQRHLSFGANPIHCQDWEPQDTGRDHSNDEFRAVFQMDQSCFHTQEAPSLKRRKPRFSLPTQPQSHHNLKQAVEWWPNPTVEKVGDIIDDLLRPSSPTIFCMDFEPSGASSPNQVFAPQLTSHWVAQASPPQPLNNGLNWDQIRDSDCFEDYSLRQRKSGLLWESRRHPFLNYARGQTACPVSTNMFFQDQEPFQMDRGSLPRNNQLHSFHQSSHLPTSSYLRSRYTDMMHYPPSYMLEKERYAPPSSPSLEIWPFPPMRLY